MSDDELRAHVEKRIEERRIRMTAMGWEPEEIERRLALQREGMFCRAREISVCCRAPYDPRSIIQSGRFKGHGSYNCSKCGESQFQV
jgi:hypothetical protein